MFLCILVYGCHRNFVEKNANKLLINCVKNIHKFIILNMKSTSNFNLYIRNNYLKSPKPILTPTYEIVTKISKAFKFSFVKKII